MGNSGDPRGGRVWARMVAYIVRRDPQCKLQLEGCTGKSETADHIIPVESEGSNRPDNLQGACHACNWKRGKKSLEELQTPQETQNATETASEVEGMQLLYDGAEKPSHRVLLTSMGVKNFAFSFFRAYKRGFPKTKPYMLSEYFEEDAEIYVDSGWMQAQEKLEDAELDAYVAAYDEFLKNNLWRVSGATEMHLSGRGMPWISEWRRKHAEEMQEGLIWPVWIPEHGQPMLASLARDYDNVALTNKAVTDPVVQTRLGALERQYQTNFHAQSVANPDTLMAVPLATTSTISWASPQMRGETIVWDGSRLVRYQAKMKDQARSRYKAIAEKAGLDHAKIVADDATEVTKLAVWSYAQLERSMSEKRPQRTHEVARNSQVVNNREKQVSMDFEEEEGGALENRELEVRNGMSTTISRRPEPRQANERMFLPGFAVEEKEEVEQDGDRMTIRTSATLKSEHQSLRQCNTCVISANCPAFREDSECAFSLPVEVRTKEQLKSLLQSIVEIQGQRVAFARFAEELNGGYPDPNLSQEIDRMFRIVKNVSELEQNKDFVRLTVERQQAGGVLSAIFGDRADALKELPAAVDGDQVIGQVMGPGSQ